MRRAIEEMSRRREKQLAYNKKHRITPRSIEKSIPDLLESIHERDYVTISTAAEDEELYAAAMDLPQTLRRLKRLMKEAAAKMDFEKAAEYRDRIRALEQRQIEEGLS